MVVHLTSVLFKEHLHSVIPGAYEPPKVAKERITCVPLKYKFMHETGRGHLCMYMYTIDTNFPYLESVVLEFVFQWYPVVRGSCMLLQLLPSVAHVLLVHVIQSRIMLITCVNH